MTTAHAQMVSRLNSCMQVHKDRYINHNNRRHYLRDWSLAGYTTHREILMGFDKEQPVTQIKQVI